MKKVDPDPIDEELARADALDALREAEAYAFAYKTKDGVWKCKMNGTIEELRILQIELANALLEE